MDNIIDFFINPIFCNANVAVILASTDFIPEILYVNKQYEIETGYTAAEMVGKSLDLFCNFTTKEINGFFVKKIVVEFKKDGTEIHSDSIIIKINMYNKEYYLIFKTFTSANNIINLMDKIEKSQNNILNKISQ